MRYPTDYKASDTQPRRKLNYSIKAIASHSAWDIVQWMYDNPYRGYLINDPARGYVAELLVKLINLGLVAQAHNGYQLTPDGRYYVTRDRYNELQRVKEADRIRYQIFDEYEEWNGGNFDLLDF